MKELLNFYLEKFGLQRNIRAFHQSVDPIRAVGQTRTMRYVTEGNQIFIISKFK
jgi:hypothetical protein